MNPSGRIRWPVFAGTLAATLATVITFWVLVPPTYLTNDDVTIRRGIEGLTAPGATPTGYVQMTHSMLAWALVALQRVVHVHTWDVVVGALLIWSIAVTLALGWSMADAFADRVLIVAAVLAAIAPLMAGMQFTISATLAGGAAAFTLATELFLRTSRRSVLTMAAALLMLGLLVRPMGAAAGSLLAFALLLPLALGDRTADRLILRRFAIGICSIAALAVALVYLDDALYRLSPAWAAYHENNWTTARLFEWGGDLPSSTIEPLRTKLGWSANDWDLLRRMWGVDPTIHSEARIDALYNAWSSLVNWRVRLAWLAERTRADVNAATVVRLARESAAPCAVALLMVIAMASRRGVAAALAATAIALAACMALEIGFKELPFRLFGPLQACYVLSIAVICCRERRVTRTALTAVCAAACLVLFVHEGGAAVASARADSEQSRQIDAQVTEVLRLHPALLVLHADSFPSEYWWRPFHTPPVQLSAIQLGLNNVNPDVQRFLAGSFAPSLLYSICSDPSILVVAEQGRLDPVTAFMREHYGRQVEWQLVFSGSFRVWRCSTRGPA